jgi:hypothetical protein
VGACRLIRFQFYNKLGRIKRMNWSQTRDGPRVPDSDVKPRSRDQNAYHDTHSCSVLMYVNKKKAKTARPDVSTVIIRIVAVGMLISPSPGTTSHDICASMRRLDDIVTLRRHEPSTPQHFDEPSHQRLHIHPTCQHSRLRLNPHIHLHLFHSNLRSEANDPANESSALSSHKR